MEMMCSWKNLLQVRLIRPFVFFITEPVIQLFGLYLAFTYGAMYRESRKTSTFAHRSTCFECSILDRNPFDLSRCLRLFRRYRQLALYPARDGYVWRSYDSFENHGQDVRLLKGEG